MGIKVSSNAISLLAGLGTGFSRSFDRRENAYSYGSILGFNENKMREMLPEDQLNFLNLEILLMSQ